MINLGWVRAGYGLALLSIPRHTAGLVMHGSSEGGVPAVVRVLGLREIVQATTFAPRPSRPVSMLGLGIDGLHASTMLVLAAASPKWRRAALTSATIAGVFALLDVQQRRTLPRAGRGDAVRAARVPQGMTEQFLDVRDAAAARLLRMGPAGGSSRTQRGHVR